MSDLNMPKSIKDCGITEQSFMAKVPQLADHAIEDQCTTSNPRMPLVKELEEIYRKAFNG